MSDINIPFLNGINPTSAGTFNSTVIPTTDLRDFSIMLLMPTTTGSASDTLNITLEESDQREFTDAERIRAVRIVDTNGVATVSADGTLTEVLGGTTSPDATLQQKFNLSDNNVNKFLRAKYTIVGTATSFTDISLILLANKKV